MLIACFSPSSLLNSQASKLHSQRLSAAQLRGSSGRYPAGQAAGVSAPQLMPIDAAQGQASREGA